MRIIGIDQEMSSTNAQMGARYFQLDGVPDARWAEGFMQCHRQEFDMMKRAVTVQNTWVIVECPFDEMQHQINFLNSICDKVNAAIIADEQKAQEAQLQEKISEEEKRKVAQAHFSKLKFDK